MRRKIVMAVLGLVMVSSICACGKNESSDVNVVDTEVVAKVEVINTEVSTELEVVDTEVVETEVSTESSEVAVEEFTVVAMNATKYVSKQVNVRKGPSADYEKVGSLSMNDEVEVIGQADTGWYQIRLGSEIAYVSDNYLVDTKVEVAKAEAPVVDNSSNEVAGGAVDSGDSGNDYVASEPVVSEPVVDEVVSDDSQEWTDEEIKDFWDDAEEAGGSFDDCTDGYGPGVEIEITPLP